MKDMNSLTVYSEKIVYPIDAKVGGLQSQGVKGEAVVHLLRTIDNEGSGVLRLSRRKHAKIDTILWIPPGVISNQHRFGINIC